MEDIVQIWELQHEIIAIESGEYIGEFAILNAEVNRRRAFEKMAALKMPGTDWKVSVNDIVRQARIKFKQGKLIIVKRDNKFPQNSIFTYDQNKNFSRTQLQRNSSEWQNNTNCSRSEEAHRRASLS
jgi:hypothetical protein